MRMLLPLSLPKMLACPPNCPERRLTLPLELVSDEGRNDTPNEQHHRGSMQPIKCSACGGATFHHDQLKAGMPGAPLFVGGFLRSVPVVASVCLACGLIASHVDEAALAKLRARHPNWNDTEAAI